MGSNPFRPLQMPVADPGRLFGRDSLVTDLVSLMTDEQPDCLALWGPRRIGKTSALKTAATLADRADSDTVPIVVYEDCGVWGTKNGEGVLHSLATQLSGWLGIDGGEIQDGQDRLSLALDRCDELGVPVTFVFDEIGRAAANSRLGEWFFSYLRGLTSKWNVRFLTASPYPLNHYWQGLPTADSTFFGLFSSRLVASIESAAGAQLLESGISGHSRETLVSLSSECGNIPLILRHVGDWLLTEDPSLPRAMEAIGRNPEILAVLGQLAEWNTTVAGLNFTTTLIPSPGFVQPLHGPPPPELREIWHRIEKSAQTQLREAERLWGMVERADRDITVDTAAFAYGKALELQVRHTLGEGLKGAFTDSPLDSLGALGRRLKDASLEPLHEVVREFLVERRAQRSELKSFGERLIRVGVKYRNPGAHDVNKMTLEELHAARATVVGTAQRQGLIADAIKLHWGDV